jgi:integrase
MPRPTKNRINFTKDKLNALPLPEPGKRVTYLDERTPGLTLRVTDRGAKTFAVYRWVDNTATRVTIGKFPQVTVEQARKRAQEINGDFARGENPNEVKKKAKAELTFGSLFEKFMDEHAKLHKKSWTGDQSQYDLYLKDRWSSRRASSITKSDCRELHSEISVKVSEARKNEDGTKKKGKPEQGGIYVANRVLALIRTIYNWGLKNEVITWPNPATGITMNKEKSRERRLFSHELPAFFKALAEEPNEAIRDYILLSLLTGARRSNVLEMKWEEISFDRAIWTIPETKNGDGQEVPLVEKALEILKSREKDSTSPYVFPSTGKAGHLVEPKGGWKRILSKSGLTGVRLHDLRRTLGSWQVDTGASIVIVGKTLNHKSQATTAIYARLDNDPVRVSMETATKAMFGAGRIKSLGVNSLDG